MVLFLTGACIAQNDMIANINLQFRFANPGARAMALGGAFVGLADDTTAIFANPAGLSRLANNTASMELLRTDQDHTIPFYSGSIVQTGQQAFDFNLDSRDFPESTYSVPFASFVMTGNPVHWGAFYAEQARFNRQFHTEEIYVPHYPDRPVVRFDDFYFFPSRNRVDLTVQSLGLSAAASLSERFQFGITALFHQIDYSALTDLILPDILPEGHPAYPYINETYALIEARGDEQTWGWFAGFMFTPNEVFSLGLSYKRQPDFDYVHQVTQRDFTTGELVPGEPGTHAFHIPDSLNLGISFKPSETFLVSLEVNRVAYSELVEDYHHFFDTGGYTQTVEDATEYHAGLEYFILRFHLPLALRAGYWFEPYHALKNTFLDTQILYWDEESRLAHIRNAVFLQRFEEDTDHITMGLGVTLTRDISLDLAADLASTGSNLGLSGVYRF